MDPNATDPLEQQQSLEELAGAVVDVAPEGWRQLTYVACRVGAYAQDLLVFRAADEKVYQLPVPDGVYAPVEKLKKGLYAPGKGTGAWLTMTVSVHESMKCRVNYEYDSEPDPRFTVNARAYLQELERFPREKEHTPEWMWHKIQEARGIDTGPIIAEFGQELVRACQERGARVEYLPPTGLRLYLPGQATTQEIDLADTFDQAVLHGPKERGELADRFAAFVANRIDRQNPQMQGPAPEDTVGGALTAAFAALGAQVFFQDPNTLVMPIPGGDRASTDISGFRSALKDATSEQIQEHASGFARAAIQQLADAPEQPSADTGDTGRLRVRLYPVTAFPEEAWEQLVVREFAPGLRQVVVVDSPESLQPLTRKALEDTGRPVEEVFTEAIGGTLQEPVDVSGHDVQGTQVVHVGGQHPYVAGQVHALNRHLGQVPHGALVCFPVPEVILAHPLGQGHPVAAMRALQELAQRFASDADKPISAQLFWWHPGSASLAREDLPDLRPVGLETDQESGRETLHVFDDEFGPLFQSLVQGG